MGIMNEAIYEVYVRILFGLVVENRSEENRTEI